MSNTRSAAGVFFTFRKPRESQNAVGLLEIEYNRSRRKSRVDIYLRYRVGFST